MALTIVENRRSVIGDLKILLGRVTLSTTASYFSTGMDIVEHCSVQSEGTVGGNSEVQVILNSNNGTRDSSPGDVWIDAGAGQEGSFMAIGK